MNEYNCPRELLNDAYTSSSLLQKAIRRGEAELALLAAEKLLPKRGKGIWRRLLAIAFEDVGVANSKALGRVLELAEHHLSDRTSAASHGIGDAIVTLAESPKSRSADHLICSARQHLLSKSVGERVEQSDLSEVLAIAGDPSQPLITRMAILIDTCGRTEKRALSIQSERQSSLRSVLPRQSHDAIDLCLRGFKLLKDGIVLPLPLLDAAVSDVDSSLFVFHQKLPEYCYVNEVPTWVWDKHTSIGKRAFRKLIQESEPVSDCLGHYVCPENYLAAACMAGFYVDAAPVVQRLEWAGSVELELAGRTADMRKAGCPPCGIEPLVNAVADNIDHLNAIRLELAGVNLA